MWNDEANLQLLREVTFFYLYKSTTADGGRPLAELAEQIEAKLSRRQRRGHGQRWVYEALRRFIFFETIIPANPFIPQALYDIVIPWFRANASKGEIRDTHYIGRMQKRGWFVESPSSEAPQSADLLWNRDVALSAVELLKNYFSAHDEQFEQAAVTLIGKRRCAGPTPTNEDRQGYATYRYSAVVGHVAKTFTIFTPPSDEYPYCSFRNFYADDDAGVRKVARGIAISLQSGIYCLGETNGGQAVKSIVLPNPMKDAQLISGLVLTISASGRPLASRIVLERTPAKHSDQCRPQIIHRDDVKKMVSAKITRRMRNYVEFYLPPIIQSLELRKSISTTEMVDLTNRYCQEKFSLAGKSFNPADHSFYPFNQALTAFEGSDRK